MIAVLLAVLGFAAVTQVRTNSDDTNYSAYREQDLVDLLSALSATSERVQSQITQLEQTRLHLQQNTSDRQAALAQADKQLSDLKILAGTVPAQGPGIAITITDPDNGVATASVLDLIEELRSAGVEAMSFNDRVRVVADTAIDATGAGITVDGVQLHSPYVLTAIGDPTTLAGAVTFARGPEYILEHDVQGNPNGATVDVAQKPQVLVRPVVTR
ncbi:DUF881 domain-containing protein [Nocardioides baekrokdamisoli]|uniref:DUF881 domain-containing protein n=1 Tax=Nocardioides baekrokdamisoli TaxID=1804624 RepID=UPI0013DE49CB|nr:DUF881 domain-containing protein [Nocardioides baekrokdamisoli]